MVGALAVELAACGSGSTSSASSSGNHGSTPTVTVGLAVPTSDYAPLYLGVDKGLFKKAGLNVKLVTFHGGSDVVKGVASGSADIGVTALAGVLSAVQQNQPLKVFYGGFNMTEFQWYASDGITSVQQAKGKSWGVTKIGSSTDFLTRYLAKQHGLKPKTDIKIVQSGGSAARLAAQKAGQIQVNIFAPPETFEAQKLGYHRIAKQSDLMDGYPFHVEFANQSFIKQNPMTVKKFLRGLVMGMKLTHSNPKAAQRSFVHHVKIDPKYASRTYQSWINGIEADGSLPSAKAMDVFWKIGIENGQFDHRIPKSKWLDTKWINSYPQWTQ
jgi:NitT/TauT family transport system substrate-binding protein